MLVGRILVDGVSYEQGVSQVGRAVESLGSGWVKSRKACQSCGLMDVFCHLFLPGSGFCPLGIAAVKQ